MRGQYQLYVGAYTNADHTGNGIGLATLDSRGTLRISEHVTTTHDPSFLAVGPDARTLYAVNELAQGRVVSFAVGTDGVPHQLNSQPTLGSAPCHLSVHPGGRYLLTANYLSGNLVVHPIDEGGVLREACHVVQHSGSGPDQRRQRGPHAHQVLPDPSGRHVLAADLGTDTVYVYDFDDRTGHLALSEEAKLRPGSGPRHLAFHPDGNRLYLINELASTMTEIGYDSDTGALDVRATVSTLPCGYTGESLGAEVAVSPDGRFVLGSNRGHDSIAVFSAVEAELRLIGIESARVAEPRYLGFAGTTVLAAGQNSSTVQAFELTEDGGLAAVGEPVPTPSPVCLLPIAA